MLFHSSARADQSDGVEEDLRVDTYLIDVEVLNNIYEDMADGNLLQEISQTIVEVSWTDDCSVTLKAQTIFPELSPLQFERNEVNAEQRELYDELRAALDLYELEQLQIWRQFARELKRHECTGDLSAIQGYWRSQVEESKVRLRYGVVFVN